MMRFAVLILAVGAFGLSSCRKHDEYKNLDCGSINSSYSKSIRPIVDRNCTLSGCHNASSSNGNFTTYEGLVARVRNGTLSKRVLYSKDMPPSGPLSLDDRKKIKCWIDAGGPEN